MTELEKVVDADPLAFLTGMLVWAERENDRRAPGLAIVIKRLEDALRRVQDLEKAIDSYFLSANSATAFENILRTRYPKEETDVEE